MCDLQICRVCLTTAVKGYRLEKHSLCSYYEYLLRQKLNPKDGLPQWVCYECALMLHKYHKFKEKCLQGQNVLKQISLRGTITYESVAVVNRYSEKLISSIGLAVPNKRIRTTTLRFKQHLKHKILRNISVKIDEKHRNAPVETVDIKTESSISGLSKKIQIISLQNTTNFSNTSVNINNIELGKNVEQEEVKNENINKIITVTCPDPIKDEIAESYIDNHLNSIFGSNEPQIDKDKSEQNTENVNIDSGNSNCDSDINFDITEHANDVSSEDESLTEILKRKVKAKRKTTRHKELKTKKTKMDMEKVELKNTKPKKHFLNPQFWKKISLSEEDAVREFKRREFDNDYYLKAKYKCQNCFKGFSKNDMLVRHLKHWHDESSGAVECRFCHMRFRHRHQLVKHMQEHLILHHCLQCDLHFSRLQAALAHQEHHNGIKRTCEHCGKEFNHLSTYYTHLRMSHKSSHVCVACGASFVSENGLHLHIKFKHFVESEQLEEWMRKQREASNKKNSAHEQPGNGDGQTIDAADAEEIYCVKCDIKFMSRHAFNIHFFNSKNHDDDSDETDLNKIGAGPRPNSKPKIPTSCPHCHKDFPTRQGYIKHHKAEHTHIPLNIPKKRDICEVCGASIQMGSIQYHMKSHTGERDFACPAPSCGMRFTLKYNMKRHYNVKHLGIPAPKYVRRTPGRRKKKNQEILENEFSPFVRTKTGYFL